MISFYFIFCFSNTFVHLCWFRTPTYSRLTCWERRWGVPVSSVSWTLKDPWWESPSVCPGNWLWYFKALKMLLPTELPTWSFTSSGYSPQVFYGVLRELNGKASLWMGFADSKTNVLASNSWKTNTEDKIKKNNQVLQLQK